MKKIKDPKVSILFVNFNGKKDTFELIESIKKIKYKNYDIIIVDNGSIDGTQEDFKKKKYDKIATLIENKKNIGVEGAANIGFKEALRRKSDYICYMDNDELVKPDFLNFLVAEMEKHPDVAVAQSKVYYANPKNMIWCAGAKYTFRGYRALNQGEIDNGQTDGRTYVDAVDGNFMIRTSVLKEIGFYDYTLFFVDGPMDWLMRAEKKGYKALYIPKSVIWHKVSGTSTKLKMGQEIRVYYPIRNWILIIKKNKSFPYFLGVLFLELSLLAAYRFFKFIKKGQPSLIKTYYIAIWHALINKTPIKLYPYR
jgi:hypothetical protein